MSKRGDDVSCPGCQVTGELGCAWETLPFFFADDVDEINTVECRGCGRRFKDGGYDRRDDQSASQEAKTIEGGGPERA